MKVKNLEIIGETLKLIKEGTEKINDLSQPVIIVCGDTGAGKSTLINYLVGETLTASQVNGRKLINTVNPEPPVKIGHKKESQTFLPDKVIDKANNIAYWDCPGFDDSRGVSADIATSFYINKLFNSENLKILLVIDEPSLTGTKRGKAFKELVVRLNNLFVNQEDFLTCTSIVFTKVRDVEDFKEEIKQFFDAKHIKEYILLQAIINLPMAHFDLPKTVGDIGNEQRLQILDNIDKSNFIKSPEVNITISTDSLMMVQELAHHVRSTIVENSIELANIIKNNIPRDNLEFLINISIKLKSIWEDNNLKSLDIIQEIVSIVNNIEATANNIKEKLSAITNEISILEEMFNNFFSKILHSGDMSNEEFHKQFCLDLGREVQTLIIEIENKDNKEKIAQLVENIDKEHAAYKEELKNQEVLYEQKFNLHAEEMRILSEQYKEEKQKRIDFNTVINQQNALFANLQEQMKSLQENSNNSDQFAELTEKMLGLTNAVVEIANKPNEVHNHYSTTIYEDSGSSCEIM